MSNGLVSVYLWTPVPTKISEFSEEKKPKGLDIALIWSGCGLDAFLDTVWMQSGCDLVWVGLVKRKGSKKENSPFTRPLLFKKRI